MGIPKRKVNMQDGSIYIAGFGNENILINIIKCLEKDINRLSEDKKGSISSASHFFAWITLYCTYFSNELYHSYHRLTGDNEIFKTDNFSSIIAKIKKYHKENPNCLVNVGLRLDNVMMNVHLIMDLRNCFQHGGLPNRLIKLKHAKENDIANILKPSNYERTKEIIELALKFTSTLPKPTIMAGNLMKIGE